MLLKDYRIIKQIRDQFSTSNYLIDSLKTVSKVTTDYLTEDIFIQNIPITYFIETELIKANATIFKIYEKLISTIFTEFLKALDPKPPKDLSKLLEEQPKKNEKKRRVLMNLSFNLNKETNTFVCEELFKYFETVVPKELLDKNLLQKYNLTRNFKEFSNDMNRKIISLPNKSVQTLPLSMVF